MLAEAGCSTASAPRRIGAAATQLAARYPKVRVEPDPIFVRAGNVYTSAGVTAGMDLALALVEEDHGPTVARQVARELVLFLKRPGGQSQFSAQLAVQLTDRAPLAELQAWMVDHLADDLSVAGAGAPRRDEPAQLRARLRAARSARRRRGMSSGCASRRRDGGSKRATPASTSSPSSAASARASRCAARSRGPCA